SGFIQTSDPLGSLSEYAERVTASVKSMKPDSVKRAFDEKRSRVNHLLQTKTWIERFPGKQLLDGFLAQNAPAMTRQDYLASAVGFMSTGELHSEISRLRATITAKSKAALGFA